MKSILFQTGIGRMFLVLWTGGLLLIAARIGWESKTVVYGSVIVRHGKSCDYLMYVPPGFHDAEYRYPLLFYLHGSGERNRSVRRLARTGVVHSAGHFAKPSDFPFLVICPKTDHHVWEPERVIALLDELLQDDHLRWQIDPARIYLTGFSMGGFGVWSIAAKYPDRFAAIVPVAGGGDTDRVEPLAQLPVWAFHGALDDVVPCENSVIMIEALRTKYPEMQDKYRLTVYPDLDHGIHLVVYGNIELYRWLLQHTVVWGDE